MHILTMKNMQKHIFFLLYTRENAIINLGDNMKRKIMENLVNWKKSKNKKPLLIIGARQIGKTYIMKEFGKTYFKETIYLNFEKDPVLSSLFEMNLIPSEILKRIEVHFERTIDEKEVLLIFDEIQAAPLALTSLKYFNESEKQYNILAAGSTLGIYLNSGISTFPVGKARIIQMYPMDFEEFLLAKNRLRAIKAIKESIISNNPFPKVTHDQLLELYRQYLYVGGFPDAVYDFVSKNNLMEFDTEILNDINNGYSVDMLQYAGNNDSMKIKQIFNSIPLQLSKENKKFQYSKVQAKKTSRFFGSSVEWLVSSNMILKSTLVEYSETPILTNLITNSFKLFYLDTGLMARLVNISPKKIMDINSNYTYKGALTETYVATQLISIGMDLHYWKNNTSELDFLIEKDDEIYPIEVKSGNNIKSRSLGIYIGKYSPKFSIRFSTKNFGFENNIKSIPLYAVFAINKLFE